MAHDPDTGLVKRGLALLLVMLLLVTAVLFIVFQGQRAHTPPSTPRPELMVWSVAAPASAFPGSVSWSSLAALSSHVPSPVGWEIRHNAAATLARRGSDHVPWATIREMLDLEHTTVNLRVQLDSLREQRVDVQETPEATARILVGSALKAVAEWHTKRRAANRTDIPMGLTAVYEAVDRLAESTIPDVRDQAKKTQQTLFRG